MKKTYFLLALSFLGFFIQAQSWIQVADFPSDGRDDGACFTIDSMAYCGTGVKPFIPLGDFYAFNLITEQWQVQASLPTGQERQYACGFASDNYGYIFGGYASSFLGDLWQYQPNTNQWQTKSAIPAAARSGAASFVIDSIAYIIGGKNQGNNALAEVWAYNMNSDHWQQKQDLPFGPRWRSGACAFNGKGYLAFGLDDTLLYTQGLYEYNPTLDSWTLLSTHPEGGRNYTKLYALGNKLFSIGGNDSSLNFLNECWEYDLQTDQWKKLPDLPGEGRRGGMSFKSAAALYYTTGLADSSERLIETIKLTDPTFLGENSIEKQLTIYPNPAKEKLNIDFSNWGETALWLSVFKANGSLILRKKLNGRNPELDCQTWPKGVYIVQVSNQKGLVRKKVIKY
tara:strand:- start:19958 stop:21151 length:1194 start_codon:yes stop_codon:yes gene_type:complete